MELCIILWILHSIKTTIVIENEFTTPFAILIHSEAPHDTKIFTEIMETLKKRRLIRKETQEYSIDDITNKKTTELAFPNIQSFL